MPPRQIQCPSCGAPHPISNPGIMMVVCEYCGNAVYWDEDRLKNAGKQSVLPEGFSRLYRGATGSLHGKRFVVLGRIRYSFGRGFWDEWFLELPGGRTAWLTEDNHEFALETRLQGAVVPPFHALKPGKIFELYGDRYMVEEAGQAECLGMEGDLLTVARTGERYPYVDASSLDGSRTLGIEWDEQPPTVFRGRWVSPLHIRMDDEGQDW